VAKESARKRRDGHNGTGFFYDPLNYDIEERQRDKRCPLLEGEKTESRRGLGSKNGKFCRKR